MERGAKDNRAQGAQRGDKNYPRLTYVPREDATPESELATLAAVYAFILERRERKQAADAAHGEVATEVGDAEDLPHKPSSKEGGG